MASDPNDTPEKESLSEDQFAERLEELDRQIADGERVVAPTPKSGSAKHKTDIENACDVLALLNNVRKREPDTDRESPEEKTHRHGGLTLDRSPASGYKFDQIDSYVIEDTIARGGMGIVFRARHLELERVVALKMLLAGPFANEEERLRFRGEAEAAASLDHPGIVPVFDVGEYRGQPYFTMGYIEGESLSARIRREPVDANSAAVIALQIAEAVSYAHQRGVIHRDIKPANILIDQNDHPRIADFGLARRTSGESDLTGTEQVLGTPSYMAPEQASGHARLAGPLADVYSVGATLYAMLTGSPPFQAATAPETLRLVIDQEPVEPRRLNQSIPADLNTICLRCLSKDPRRRYPSSQELAEDLRRFLDHRPIEARPVGRGERLAKWSRRHPAVAALSMATALAIATLLVGGVVYQYQLTRTLTALEDSRKEAVDSLYRSLTSEAEFLTEVRPLGFAPRVASLISDAGRLDTRQKDPLRLRQLAISGLGYSGAREPLELPSIDSTVRSANVLSESGLLFAGLESGDLVAFDLDSGDSLQQIHVLDQPITRIQVGRLNHGTEGKQIRVIGEFGKHFADLIVDKQRTLKIASVRKLDHPPDFLGLEPTPDGRYLIGVQPVPTDMSNPRHWLSPSTVRIGSDPSKGRRRREDEPPVFFAVASIDDPTQPVRKLPFPYSPRFDVNDHYIVVGRSWLDQPGTDSMVAVHDFRTGESHKEINTTCGSLLNVRISENGYYVAAGSHYGFEVFERSSGKRLLRNTDFGRAFVDSFVGDSAEVVLRSARRSIWISPKSPRPIATFDEAGNRSQIRFASGGRFMIWVDTHRPRLIDTLGTERLRIRAHSMIAKSVAFSPDTRYLLTTTKLYGGNLTRIWNSETGDLQFEFVGAESTFSPDGECIASWSGGLKLWETKTGKRLASASFRPFPQTIRFDPSGNFLVAAAPFPGELAVWRIHRDAADKQDANMGDSDDALLDQFRLVPIRIDGEASDPVAFSPDGNSLAYARGNQLVIRSLSNDDEPEIVFELGTKLRNESITFLDSDRIAVVTDVLQVLSPDDGKAIYKSSDQRHPPIIVSPDRRHLMCRRTLLRSEDLSEVYQLPAWLGTTSSASWSNDGRRIAYGLDNGEVMVWNLAEVDARLRDLELPTEELAFSGTSDFESIDAMIRVGSRDAGLLDPQQWSYRVNNLLRHLESEFDHLWVMREVNWLADRIGRIAPRPFFEDQHGDPETILSSRLGQVYQAAQRLQTAKEYSAALTLLAAAEQAFRMVPDPDPTTLRIAALIHHCSGDIYNYSHPDPERCVQSYRAEESLLNRLIDRAEFSWDPDESQSDFGIPESLFWLNRNWAAAHRRAGDTGAAAERMREAIAIANKTPDLKIGPQVLDAAKSDLKSWLEAMPAIQQ